VRTHEKNIKEMMSDLKTIRDAVNQIKGKLGMPP
jgi:hypothetical protein